MTTRSRAGVAAAVAGGLLFAALVAVRAVAFGVDLDGRGTFGIGGLRAAWTELGDLLSLLPVVTAGAAAWVLVALTRPIMRSRALFAAVFLLVANVGGILAKDAAALVLPSGRGTLPSGHATLALSSAAVVMLLATDAWRDVALPAAGFLGTLGPLGVVAALSHTPADALAAEVLMPVWLGAACLAMRMLVRVPWCVGERRGPSGGRHLARHEDTPRWVLLAGGAATTVVMLLGWGFELQRTSVAVALVGLADFVVLPLLAVVLLDAVARVGDGLTRATH